MAFPIKVCVICSEEFELKPDKPGFANRCPECSATEADERATKDSTDAFDRNKGAVQDAWQRSTGSRWGVALHGRP